VRDELKLTVNAVTVLRERYLLKDPQGRVVESTGEMMRRVARHVAQAEPAAERERWEERFASALTSLELLPNSPTLMNAGTRLGLLSGCFVLPVEDSLDSIFTALRQMALIHQAGGGTGFAFSRLRPHGDVVASTHGVASGPVSFMTVFDAATEVVKQGGRRRGANMAVLDASHPDIEEFIAAKATAGRLENFNLSVGVTDAFMRAVERDGTHRLINPRTGRVSGTRPARQLFGAIAAAAHRTGDPGLLFLDRINRNNPVPALGRIESTNPCGEVPLLPFESCNLGSVNLARMVSAGRPDWDRLGATVRLAVRLLDDVIEVNRYPIPEVQRATLTTRKIGVGVMGLAELLAALRVPYDSQEALRLARPASPGSCATRPSWPRPSWPTSGAPSRRSSTARWPPRDPRRCGTRRSPPSHRPEPSRSSPAIAGTTSGIEPLFAVAYVRNVLGARLLELNGLFERTARERGFYSEALVAEIARTGGVRDLDAVPQDVRRAFVTALEVRPEWHLRMQAAFQRSVDAAVAKTVNLPASATVDDVWSLYLRAWRLGLKGITVYRYGSRPGQVRAFLANGQRGLAPPVQVGPEYAGGCAGHVCEV
jgi:ribonucleoside-diphosphate reductase alpha chain